MDGQLPEDDSRVSESYKEGKASEHLDEHAAVILRRKLCFFVCKGVIAEREKRWIMLTIFVQSKS
jgi:hypothetical protein